MKLLLAIDDTKVSKDAVSTVLKVCKCLNPEKIVLLHVEKLEGRSLIDAMLGDPELETLRQAIKGSGYKEALDKKGKALLESYKKALGNGTNIRTVLKSGHPADEILNTASREKVDMIVVGSKGKRVSRLFMGSVSREVAERSPIPVLIVK